MHVKRKIVATLALLISLGTAAADTTTRYVSDHLIITLRAGQGDEFRILKSLPSGTRVELLEEGAGGEFARIRTEDGTEGWVRSWYLADTPPAGLLLDEAQRKAERLEAENKKLLADNRGLTQAHSALVREQRELRQTHETVAAENERLKDIAARPMELESENKRLSATVTRLTAENTRLAGENRTLRNSSVQKWFMAGSGVLVVGVILGLVLPRLRRRGTSNWWT